LPGLKNYENS